MQISWGLKNGGFGKPEESQGDWNKRMNWSKFLEEKRDESKARINSFTAYFQSFCFLPSDRGTQFFQLDVVKIKWDTVCKMHSYGHRINVH